MGSLSRAQRIILIVLAVLDLVVIGGLVAIVASSLAREARPAVTPTREVTENWPKVPTWTPTLQPTPSPTQPPRPTNTPTPTSTPVPTFTATPTPTPLPPGPVPISDPGFDFVMPNRISGWKWDAYVNYKSGDPYDPATSYAEPIFTAADDPVRQINGPTLKVETIRWLKFRAWVHQTVTVTAGSQAYFSIKAKGFSSLDSVIVKAGIDPTGADNCYGARWGQEQRINQNSGTVTLTSPTVTVLPFQESGSEKPSSASQEEGPVLGRVTICFFAEPAYPHINNAAFFDEAELIVAPPH